MTEGTHQYCANCGYPAVGWATARCPECGSSETSDLRLGESLGRVLTWLLLLLVTGAVPVVMWFGPHEDIAHQGFDFHYDPTNQHYTPGRGFVVVHTFSDRFVPWEMKTSNIMKRYEYDPSLLDEIEVALFDGTVVRGQFVGQLRQAMDQVNVLNYDPVLDQVRFIENGQDVITPLDRSAVERWIAVAYPNLEPELADLFSDTIPLAIEDTLQGRSGSITRDKLHAIDELFGRSGSSAAAIYQNDDPLTLRFSVTYALVTAGLFLLVLAFPGRYLHQAFRHANWHIGVAWCLKSGD
ncbi:MAG: hypothetical protein KTR15_13580 [Phycisphaeraceae bacterium]|nr:hypothetical protein [Phycisphaeraceae bacterium]